MKIIKFLREWNELLTLPVALILWWYSGDILRWIDPMAGVFDAGILQVFLLATIGLLFGHALIWLMLRLSAKEIYSHFDDFLNNNPNISPWQKGLFSLSYFFLLLLSWVLLVNALA
mgnify:CR=1 FL=1|jgi:hypothetical protein